LKKLDDSVQLPQLNTDLLSYLLAIFENLPHLKWIDEQQSASFIFKNSKLSFLKIKYLMKKAQNRRIMKFKEILLFYLNTYLVENRTSIATGVGILTKYLLLFFQKIAF